MLNRICRGCERSQVLGHQSLPCFILSSRANLRNPRHTMASTTSLWPGRHVIALWAGVALMGMRVAGAESVQQEVQAGQPADIAASAYLYRADRSPEANPPEAWVLLMQHAGLPFDRPVDTNAPAVKQALCGLLWEEV